MNTCSAKLKSIVMPGTYRGVFTVLITDYERLGTFPPQIKIVLMSEYLLSNKF